MRIVIAVLLLSSIALGQTGKTSKTGTAQKAGRHTSQTGGAAATPGANPTAVFDTTAGKMTCTLYKDKVPNAVNNFIGLATGKKDWTDPATGAKKHGQPLYNGTIFHRVIPEFMIQGGDPVGTGMGDPGYKLNDEFVPDLKFDKPGVLAYANSGPNTNGSQFFITEVPVPFLDPCLDASGCTVGGRRVPKGYGYTIFGQCDDATVDLVKKMARAPRGANDRPNEPVKINKITITGDGGAASTTAAKKAPAKKRTATKKQ